MGNTVGQLRSLEERIHILGRLLATLAKNGIILLYLHNTAQKRVGEKAIPIVPRLINRDEKTEPSKSVNALTKC